MKVQTYFAGDAGFGVAALQIGQHRVGGFVREECTLPVATCQQQRVEVDFSGTISEEVQKLLKKEIIVFFCYLSSSEYGDELILVAEVEITSKFKSKTSTKRTILRVKIVHKQDISLVCCFSFSLLIHFDNSTSQKF